MTIYNLNIEARVLSAPRVHGMKQVHYVAAEEEYLPLREKSVDGMPSFDGIACNAHADRAVQRLIK